MKIRFRLFYRIFRFRCANQIQIQSLLINKQHLSHWLLDSSGTSCVLGNVRHLAIGSWIHPECLAFRDSSGTSCVPGNVRHLAIGSWTHLERLALAGIKIV
ncbi:hypothetical protein Tco_1176679 [Tanacetum coccineum]